MALEEYRRKRDATRTPEPMPSAAGPDSGPAHRDGSPDSRAADGVPIFVIQEHHARSLHWDLRLERDGVLVSWAVPKGLPNDRDSVRLAVHTEDHPMEYADFQGEIPRGEYGAGRMAIWDRGHYETIKWTDDEVQVVLHGDRARGRYVLLHRGKAPNQWLLRRSDEPSRPDWVPLPTFLSPMLPTPGELPSADSQWCYQVGFGGSRTIVRVQGGRVTLLDAEGSGLATRTELAGLGAALGSTEALLDGEIDGAPPGLWITDLLHLDGRDTTVLPYTHRRALLEELPLTGPAWRLAPSYDEGGSVVASAAREQGLPVVVAKRATSHYLPGAVTDQWIQYRTAPPRERSETSGPATSQPSSTQPSSTQPSSTQPGTAKGASGRSRSSARTTSVEVGDRRVRLANPDKVLYPATGMRKRDVLEYYLAVAPVLLPHVAARPVTLRRWPDGVNAPSFFEKNVSRHVPDWVRTVRLATPGSSSGSDSLDYPLLDTAATVAWAANLAALELHVPQWRVDGDGQREAPDLLVFDLDPGADTTIVECTRVALLIAELLEADGLAAYPRTSGGKGMQLYSPVQVSSPDQTGRYAKNIAETLAGTHPRAVTAVMAKSRRRGKVFIDWSQNNPAKTTVASYSLRGREYPTVATPVTWPEVRRCERPDDLRFLAGDLPDRLAEHGDLLAPLLSPGRPLPAAPS